MAVDTERGLMVLGHQGRRRTWTAGLARRIADLAERTRDKTSVTPDSCPAPRSR